MGGKGEDNYTPPPVQPQVDMNAMLAPMMGMMASMASMAMQNSIQMPELPTPPTIEKPMNVDWQAKQKELQNKIAADTAQDIARRRGRSSTILTSPLADGEEPTTVSAKMSGA